jgi:hypothetical protein
MNKENTFQSCGFSLVLSAFTLDVWFDKLTRIGADPFALSLSKGRRGTIS